jgi:hypothetical protein
MGYLLCKFGRVITDSRGQNRKTAEIMLAVCRVVVKELPKYLI